MNGSALTLGLVGALAAAATLRRRGSAAKAPILAWHGTGRPFDRFRTPAFFSESRGGARWYAKDRGEDDVGYLLRVEIDIQNPADERTLIRVAKRVGVKMEEDPYFYAPTISKHSPYEGDNPLDLVYIPKVRAALMAQGFDGVHGFDPISNDDIEVWVIFRPEQAKILSTEPVPVEEQDEL